jgi:hypothetical protein
VSALTLADAKTHLNITTPDSDVELQVMIDSAEAVIAGLIGPLTSTVTTSVVDGRGSVLVLPVTPVISLTSITGAAGDSVTTANLSIIPPGIVAYNMMGTNDPGLFFFPSRWYTVVYNAGRTTVPADLLLAIKELLRHLWQTQRGGAVRPGSGPDTQSPGYLIPNRVAELLGPYLQPSFA